MKKAERSKMILIITTFNPELDKIICLMERRGIHFFANETLF